MEEKTPYRCRVKHLSFVYLETVNNLVPVILIKNRPFIRIHLICRNLATDLPTWLTLVSL